MCVCRGDIRRTVKIFKMKSLTFKVWKRREWWCNGWWENQVSKVPVLAPSEYNTFSQGWSWFSVDTMECLFHHLCVHECTCVKSGLSLLSVMQKRAVDTNTIYFYSFIYLICSNFHENRDHATLLITLSVNVPASVSNGNFSVTCNSIFFKSFIFMVSLVISDIFRILGDFVFQVFLLYFENIYYRLSVTAAIFQKTIVSMFQVTSSFWDHWDAQECSDTLCSPLNFHFWSALPPF